MLRLHSIIGQFPFTFPIIAELLRPINAFPCWQDESRRRQPETASMTSGTRGTHLGQLRTISGVAK